MISASRLLTLCFSCRAFFTLSPSPLLACGELLSAFVRVSHWYRSGFWIVNLLFLSHFLHTRSVTVLLARCTEASYGAQKSPSRRSKGRRSQRRPSEIWRRKYLFSGRETITFSWCYIMWSTVMKQCWLVCWDKTMKSTTPKETQRWIRGLANASESRGKNMQGARRRLRMFSR